MCENIIRYLDLSELEQKHFDLFCGGPEEWSSPDDFLEFMEESFPDGLPEHLHLPSGPGRVGKCSAAQFAKLTAREHENTGSRTNMVPGTWLARQSRAASPRCKKLAETLFQNCDFFTRKISEPPAFFRKLRNICDFSSVILKNT